MPNVRPDHVDPTGEEDARLEAEIAADPDDPAHWGAPSVPPAKCCRKWSRRTGRALCIPLRQGRS